MCDSLATEQAEIFQFTSTGHNVFVTGQAGIGKSIVVNAISMVPPSASAILPTHGSLRSE